MKRITAVAVMLVLLAGCSVGTKYERPATTVPENYRSAQTAAGEPSGAELEWWDIYRDETLRGLIKTALENNYDIKIAAARVEEYRALAGVSVIARLPQISAGANAQRQRSLTAPDEATIRGDYRASVDLSYELDLWGRLASLNEAARADLLGTEYAARAVRTGLISSVATAYFELVALDRQLEVAERTVVNREKFFELTKAQLDRGAVSLLEFGRAASSVSQARAAVPDIKRQIAQKENQLSALLGQDPGPILRGKAGVEDMPVPPEVPAGLPSALLERRPDIMQAEAALMAANARANATKALLYPTIRLTGEAGLESATLKSLFSDPTGIWSIAAGIIQPILDSGRNGYQVDAAQARKDQATLQYYNTLVQAFREVSDALAARQWYSKLSDVQKTNVEELQQAAALALTRYKAGYSSYFEVIDINGALFDAEIAQVKAQRDALLSLVQLYKALGGGWSGDIDKPDASYETAGVPANGAVKENTVR
jgi:outer membrane protein, multidrug efflux system